MSEPSQFLPDQEHHYMGMRLVVTFTLVAEDRVRIEFQGFVDGGPPSSVVFAMADKAAALGISKSGPSSLVGFFRELLNRQAGDVAEMADLIKSLPGPKPSA